jgi:hypothetical protein
MFVSGCFMFMFRLDSTCEDILAELQTCDRRCFPPRGKTHACPAPALGAWCACPCAVWGAARHVTGRRP